jgi:hypothetical protein
MVAEADVPNILQNLIVLQLENWWRNTKFYIKKQQNDREAWNMIDSLFITTLPDGDKQTFHFIGNQSLE